MIIIGLGNPGPEYVATRHNLGFRVLDQIAKQSNASWSMDHGVAWTKIGAHLFLKPLEFMNVSGQTLAAFLSYKHLATNPEEMVVVHDDLDLPVGAVKPDSNRSSGGHQGVENIIQTFGTQAFRRLRIGIGSNRDLPQPIPAEDYVLQAFAEGEGTTIAQAIDQAVKNLAVMLGDKS